MMERVVRMIMKGIYICWLIVVLQSLVDSRTCRIVNILTMQTGPEGSRPEGRNVVERLSKKFVGLSLVRNAAPRRLLTHEQKYNFCKDERLSTNPSPVGFLLWKQQNQ